AFMCDIMIMRATHNRASLDDVMRLLYSEFGLRNRGYSAEDYIGALEKIGGISFASFAENILNQAGSYKHLLDECLDYIGCTLRAQPSGRTSEAAFGFGIDESSGKAVVTWIEPEGPADKAGLWMGDEITAVNGTAATRSVQALLAAGKDQPMTLTVNKKMRMCELSLSASAETVRWNYTVVRSSVTSDAQNSNWEYFCSQR
ncbi:MAG: PDZ domain-containing protein, partial [Flavobacteriales bacterium]|nr:PDZ domain-containing protein [Flavobacteriales bacterium]